ncbi:hypothetical protein [Nesterenkonia sp.]|uniref:hypothetical protein n=1 Tax=Nesterenkonia sp. TaxID=704201 RepID=UPI00261B4868|nr:hypothetical protein [Nesterenkonia sp.]
MFSRDFPQAEAVLDDLGPEFVQSFITAVDGARDDYEQMRESYRDWFVRFASRTTANIIHERIWARFVDGLQGQDEIVIVDEDPTREIHKGLNYQLRIKRHHPGDKISTFATDGAKGFWANDNLALDGFESHSLAVGYLWDADLRAVGEAVLSYRSSLDSPIWGIQLKRDVGNVAGFSWEPMQPDLPEVDLTGIIVPDEEEGRAS